MQASLRRHARKMVHILDQCSKSRANLASMATALGYHAEIYSDLTELKSQRPQEGVIILRDLTFAGQPTEMMERLVDQGIWLPVIFIGHEPSLAQIVDGIKAGALDYLEFPVEADRLGDCLARVSAEATRFTIANRKMVEARERIGRLTLRERQVLHLVTQGNGNKAVALSLTISPRTVEIHRANAMTKLQAHNAVDAIRICLEAKQPVLV